MRLINTHTLELKDFSLTAIPPYAILSHTWNSEEVTLQDMGTPIRTAKKGWGKIWRTCQLAQQRGLEFAWIDTCCIDKSSSAELIESINSMFQWYKNAAVCYVFLEDLAVGFSQMDRCRWFTRGWTLQELLAPKTVEFHDMEWNYRGSRLFFIDSILKITGIPKALLRGENSVLDILGYSVATRMSWAAERKTTRVEDVAYSLLGIFGVNMPLIYGEGHNAFRRLQEEILRRTNDLTIFVWEWDGPKLDYIPLLASSPGAFGQSSGITPFVDDFVDFSITNQGVRISGDVPLRVCRPAMKTGDKVVLYCLFLGSDSQSSEEGGIYLRKIGPKLYYRDGGQPLAGFGRNEVDQLDVFHPGDYYIHHDPAMFQMSRTISPSAYRRNALHIPLNDIFELQDSVPEDLWDATDRVFLKPKAYDNEPYSMVIAMDFVVVLAEEAINLVVLCDYRTGIPQNRVFEGYQFPVAWATIFRGESRREGVYWTELVTRDLHGHFEPKDSLQIEAGNSVFHILTAWERKALRCMTGPDVDVFSLTITTTTRSKFDP